MSTEVDTVLRLPAAAIPEGCPPWSGERAAHWTRALPPRWAPVRTPASAFVALPPAAVAGAALLSASGALPAWAAALVALHLVWWVLRPEAAAVLGPVAVGVALTTGDLAPGVRLSTAAVLAGVWGTACLRLAVRRRQRAAGREAAAGVTAAAPAPGGGRAERGTFLSWCGLGTVVAGGALYAAAGLPDGSAQRQAVPAAGWCLAGLGLTLLLSGVLGRRRALALRRAPVPVLRVLVRDGIDADTEVYAADDLAALRPLFTVSTSLTVPTSGPETPRGADDAGADEDDGCRDDDEDGELRALVDRIGDGRSGPLREAVLHGVPYDGGEAVFLAAASAAGRAPVVEASLGPVRPMTPGALRSRNRAEKRTSVRAARDARRRTTAAEAVAARDRADEARTRHWRAGWADWTAVALVALFLACYAKSGRWGDAYGIGLTVLAALSLPRRLAWRVTADREGLWFNGLRGTRHLPWHDVRIVKCEGARLRIDGRSAAFGEWRVASPRWSWLEDRLGLLHPYERTAAEITAVWRTPALRPAGTATGRDRGRPLWPLGAALATAVAAGLLLLR
ncbi:PH domain-containing protein [Streptomyces sp. NPDC020597]|uniref:PH domain-containing protein n=1 Tax=unclassified Streptomyces TaxID=2593676 RepID=UPI00379FD75B